MSGQAVDRVAFYLPSFGRGGVERFVVNLAPELLNRGVAVDVLVYEASTMIDQLPATARHVELGSRWPLPALGSQLPAHVGNALVSLPGYVGYLRDNMPDLVISMQTSPFAILGARLARTDAQVVIRESNTPSVATKEPPHLIGKLTPLAKRLAYPRADRVVANSRDAAADVVEWLDLPDEQVTAIYNPTYTPNLHEQADEPVDHPWFDENTNIPVLVSVGRFVDQKDFATLLRAFAQVREDYDTRLLLVGDGDNRASLERLAARLGVMDHVDFVGYQPNPHKFVERADAFVLSSHYEGLPNVLIEALGVKTPAIATDCPSGPREILLDGEGGLLVPVSDVTAMAEAIESYLAEPADATERLARARDALDRFTPERTADKYLALAGTVGGADPG